MIPDPKFDRLLEGFLRERPRLQSSREYSAEEHLSAETISEYLTQEGLDEASSLYMRVITHIADCDPCRQELIQAYHALQAMDAAETSTAPSLQSYATRATIERLFGSSSDPETTHGASLSQKPSTHNRSNGHAHPDDTRQNGHRPYGFLYRVRQALLPARLQDRSAIEQNTPQTFLPPRWMKAGFAIIAVVLIAIVFAQRHPTDSNGNWIRGNSPSKTNIEKALEREARTTKPLSQFEPPALANSITQTQNGPEPVHPAFTAVKLDDITFEANPVSGASQYQFSLYKLSAAKATRLILSNPLAHPTLSIDSRKVLSSGEWYAWRMSAHLNGNTWEAGGIALFRILSRQQQLAVSQARQTADKQLSQESPRTRLLASIAADLKYGLFDEAETTLDLYASSVGADQIIEAQVRDHIQRLRKAWGDQRNS